LSEIFFDPFIDQCFENMIGNAIKQKSASFIDIALALKIASVEMEAGYKLFVRWAGFILLGSGNFRSQGMTRIGCNKSMDQKATA
jgi:hypothetical protein